MYTELVVHVEAGKRLELQELTFESNAKSRAHALGLLEVQPKDKAGKEGQPNCGCSSPWSVGTLSWACNSELKSELPSQASLLSAASEL